jgi:hypothetical protein
MANYNVNIGPCQEKTDMGYYRTNMGPYQGDGIPVITGQSANQSAHVGDSVSLFITAIGNPTPTYQWYKECR